MTITGTTYQRVRSSAINLSSGTTYMACYHTSSGGTAQDTSAKVIVDQTAAGGLTKMELYHYSVLRSPTTTSASYVTQSDYLHYDPAVWSGGTFTYYYEADLKTSIATASAYTQLYNTTDTAVITGSEVPQPVQTHL